MAAAAAATAADVEGLRALFCETGGGAAGTWEISRRWDGAPSASSAPLEQWWGVSVSSPRFGADTGERVAHLALPHNGLAGPLSEAALGPLAALQTLRLEGNALAGDLPAAALARMASLRSLNLSGNRLAGALPRELLGLGALVELRLGGNSLSGPLPAALAAPGRLPHLRVLRLQDNRLSGPIPAEFGRPWPQVLPSLRDLDLSGNALSGPVPAGLLERALPCFEWRLALRPGNAGLTFAHTAIGPRLRATFRGEMGGGGGGGSGGGGSSGGGGTYVLSLAALWQKASAGLPSFEDAQAGGLLHEVLPTPRLAADGLLFIDRVGHVPREAVTYVGHAWPRLGREGGAGAAAAAAPSAAQELALLRAALGGGGSDVRFAWIDRCCVPHYARAADAADAADGTHAHGAAQSGAALASMLALPRHMHLGCGSFTLLAADALDALDDGWCRAETMLAMAPRRSMLADTSAAHDEEEDDDDDDAPAMVHWGLMPVWLAEGGGAAVRCEADGLPVLDPLQGDCDESEVCVALVVALARAAAEQMEEAAGAEHDLVPAADLQVAREVLAAMSGGLAAASAAAAAAALGAAHAARVAALAAARAVRAVSTVYIVVEAAAAAAEAAAAAAAHAHAIADAALAAAAACGHVDESLFALELLQASCPPGVDAARKEAFLKLTDYQRAFGMGKEEFDDAPNFKKRQLKRAARLF